MSEFQILMLVLPLIVIQLGLMAFALRDLFTPGRAVLGGNKAVWAVFIVVGELVGPLVYFLAGRREA